MWCAVRARANTTHLPPAGSTGGPVSGAHVSPYNAAASVNMAIWLSFEVWLANTYVAEVLIISSQIDGWSRFRAFRPQYFIPSIIFSIFIQVTATYGSQFATMDEAGSLIKHLVETFFAGFGLAAAVNVIIIPLTSRKIVSMHMAENFNAIQRALGAQREFTQSLSLGDWLFMHGKPDVSQQDTTTSWPEANSLKNTTMEATIALGKVTSEMRYAKREVGWGYLGPKELANINHLLKRLMAAMLWMESLAKVTRRIPHLLNQVESMSHEEEQQKWCWLFEQRHGPTEQLIQAMKEGLDHSVHMLRLSKAPAISQSDIEANRDHTRAYLEETIDSFLRERQSPLDTWLSWTGIRQSSELSKGVNTRQRERYLFQLYFLLDLESSIVAIARRILDLVKYADLKTDTDPEHLPPQSKWEMIGDKLRRGFRFFGSPESVFGFRVAVATMTVSIVAYLRNSQHFYIEQRLIWGSIMIAISMTSTLGSAIYGQSMRLLGTFIAMVLAYIDWFIVDKQPAGVIVFVGLTMFLSHYALIRVPTHPVPPIVQMVTVTLIVGYALQVKKVGVIFSESNGQVYHALYVLSPYRLAAVVGGIGVAFIFTYFPAVTTVKSCFQRDLASFLYLLAHYYSSVYTTTSILIKGQAGDRSDKKSLGRVLEKARTRVLFKEIVLLQAMKQHTWFFAWEPTTGGSFPGTPTINWQSMRKAASFHLTGPIPSEPWDEDIRALIKSLDMKSHEVTFLLTTLSGAIKTGSPLPLYLKAPKLRLPTELLATAAPDASLVSPENFNQPLFSAIASMEMTMMALEDDLSQLLSGTKKLVGQLNLLTDTVPSEDLTANMNSIMAMEKRD
ncbi:hypothetical protein N7513_007071 [Penicillium frequentans]|nr:hypothetical protein N7513_007071 [Penicillium glabrum]